MNYSPDHFIACKQRGEKIVVLTAYDYPLARLLDETGIEIVLVGDSLGMVVLGYPDTTEVTMADMLHHCRAVSRGAQKAFIVADLPYGSYETPEQAVENAKALCEAGAHAVKLEGGVLRKAQISAIVGAGIPVMGHIGMLPQQVKFEGGYSLKGKSSEEASLLIADGLAVQDAGAFAVVLELVVPETTTKITSELKIPTIGIGSGEDCDGQVLVTYDLIGMFPWFKPRFVQREAFVGEEIRKAAERFIQQTKGTIPPKP